MAAAQAFSTAEVLKDGTPVTIRTVRPDDRARLVIAFAGLEHESVYRRFFTAKRELSRAELDRIEAMDFVHDVMLVVTVGTGEGETIVASGRYIAEPSGAPSAAEVAFTVEEDFHGRGVAGLLLRHLANLARANGIARLEAEVLRENKGMLKVFSRCGLPMRQRVEGGQVHVSLDLR